MRASQNLRPPISRKPTKAKSLVKRSILSSLTPTLTLFPALTLFLALTLLPRTVSAQFATENLRIRLGYNVQSTAATRLNHLITEFNNARYPQIIAENLPNVNFPTGWLFGASYALNPDLILHATLKNRHQFLEVQYIDPNWYRQYLFRAVTLELGASIPIQDEGTFRHLAGGGILLGVQSAYTDWNPEGGRTKARDMLNIDHSEIIGISIHYEAQILLHQNVRIFLRPVFQIAANSNLRNLNQFFNPEVNDGVVTYPEGEGDRYDKGSFNGLGLEGGIQLSLPAL